MPTPHWLSHPRPRPRGSMGMHLIGSRQPHSSPRRKISLSPNSLSRWAASSPGAEERLCGPGARRRRGVWRGGLGLSGIVLGPPAIRLLGPGGEKTVVGGGVSLHLQCLSRGFQKSLLKKNTICFFQRLPQPQNLLCQKY